MPRASCARRASVVSPGHWSLVIGHCGLGGRGFILLRLGFFGGGMISVAPPAAVILVAADFEKWCALTVSFFFTSPFPRIRTPSVGPLARPTFFNASGST